MKIDSSTLIFDLDGTISDPSLGITRCFNYALEYFGLPAVSGEVIRPEIGPPLDATFKKLVPEASASDIVDMIGKYRERYSDTGYAENTLYDGIPQALDTLRLAGKRLGICTSKRGDFAERILTLFGLREHFDFVSGGDIGISKAMQLESLREESTIDKQSVMIGDREVDINAARHNDLDAVGVLWGFGSIDELSQASPLYIIDRVEQLAELAS